MLQTQTKTNYWAHVVYLTTTFRVELGGHMTATSPSYAVQSRGPNGFEEHYRGYGIDEAQALAESLNLVNNA